jgi:hypothetical protein
MKVGPSASDSSIAWFATRVSILSPGAAVPQEDQKESISIVYPTYGRTVR